MERPSASKDDGSRIWPRYDQAAVGFRNYWYPAFIASKVRKGKPVSVTVAGEKVVLVRDGGKVYGLNDRYRGVFGRRDVLFANEADLTELGVVHGDLVEIETALPSGAARRLTLTAIVYDIARGSVAAYYPEANGLVPLDYQDEESGTPSYKSVPVRIHRAA